jgi:chromosome segregation ATPase
MALKPLLLSMAGLVVGLAVGLGYGHMQLQGQQKAFQAKARQITQRMAQAERRCAQSLAEQQTSLEDEKQQGLAETEKLQKEKQGLALENKDLKSRVDALIAQAASVEAMRAKSEAKATSEESKNGQLSALLAKTEADRKALEQKQQQTFQALQEREKHLKELNGRYDRCAENNVRLYAIGLELIKQYQDKGFLRTLVQKEPFTQIKKVELEKLVQDYRDKIDKEKVQPR